MAQRSNRRTSGRDQPRPDRKGNGKAIPSSAMGRACRFSSKPVVISLSVAVVTLALGLSIVWAFWPKDSAAHLREAKTKLTAGRAGEAEAALLAAIAEGPKEKTSRSDPEPWRLLLEILRVEERSLEADRLAWEAMGRVRDGDRPAILRELTLALLTELPDDLARGALTRWTAADRADVEARVALLRRIAASPRSGDPDRPARLAELTELTSKHPVSVNAREALVSELADAGEPDRGRSALDAWPGAEDSRDARYWRLRGRWELEYEHRPDRAAGAFRKCLAEQPHDWRTRYRLARALRQAGLADEANAEAETVRRIREVLDPLTLGPRIDSALGRIDEPSARFELSEICSRAGLTRLAEAWKGL